MDQKKTPTALDYLVIHHVCRAYLKSVDHIVKGTNDQLVDQIYVQAIRFLSEFTQSHVLGEKCLSPESHTVLGLMKVVLDRKWNRADSAQSHRSATLH